MNVIQSLIYGIVWGELNICLEIISAFFYIGNLGFSLNSCLGLTFGLDYNWTAIKHFCFHLHFYFTKCFVLDVVTCYTSSV